MSRFASSTRTCSEGQRSPRPQISSSVRQRRGRGPEPPGIGMKRAQLHVAQGGPPNTTSMKPCTARSISRHMV
eukprot:5994302-Heterocapsa_arctica.AAC.1